MNTLIIKSLTIMQTNGCDIIYLENDLPCGTYPFTGSATIRMEVAADHGESYCRNVFPECSYKVINSRT